MKKELNFEVNIMPVLDILSVMICFLLFTAVWTNIQTMDVKQAVGDNSSSGSENPPSVWAIMAEDGHVEFSLRDIKSTSQRELTVSSVNNQIDWNQVRTTLQNIKGAVPELKVALVMPKSRTDYGSVIKMLDQFRQLEINDVGIAPL